MRPVKTLSRIFSQAACALALLSLSQVAQAASAYTYPQLRSYSYGFKPGSPVGASWAADAATLLTKYNNWKGVHVTSSGAGGFLRVQRDAANGNDTVSEGISYGMLMAVYFDDQATYNGLWQYKQLHNDGLGLMNWNINSGGGTINGGNSATDADEDIAYSLYLASAQWGNGGTFNYKSLADAEVAKVKAYDLDGSNHLKPGDSFNSCRYPSYFFPNEYRVFGKQTSDTYTWDIVRNACYATIAAARNAGTGLIAEQSADAGAGGGCGVSSTQYQYNSCRVPFRMALDYVDYGDANASGELSKLDAFFGSIAPNSVGDCYNLPGSSCSGFNNAAFEGPAATGFMSAGGANLQSYYNALMFYNDTTYYSGALQLLTLLLLQGNMPNIADPGAMYTPTVTPSPTNYAGTPTFTPTATPIAFGYVFEDFEYGTMSGPYTYAGTGGSGINYAVTSAQANSGTFSGYMNLTVTTGQYAGMGFGSNYANGQGVVDATGSNAIRFAIKSDSNVTFTLQIREAGTTVTAVAGGDGELWDSPAISVAAGPGWTTRVISLTSPVWTEDAYSSNGAAGNNTLNLSAAKVIQLNFSTAVTNAHIYIDDIAFVPSVAPTPTSTKTPFNNPYNQLYDDFEAPLSLSSPARASTYADSANGASATWSLDTTTVASGAKSAKLTYNSGNAASYGSGGYFISPYGTPALYVDASGAVILGFWLNAPAGLKYKMEFQEAGTPSSPTAGADGEAWLSPLLTASAGWNFVQVDLASFTEDPYNPICNPTNITAPGPCLSGGNGIKDFQAISSVTVKVNGNQGSGALYLDDVDFITTWKTSTPSVSPSPTASATRTATPSPSPSGTPTATRTPTSTPTASPSQTATGTPTPLAPTLTDTLTASQTVTLPTATSTHTPLPGSTFTDTSTVSPVQSATSTITLTAVNTATATPSQTAVITSTQTVTPPPTATATNTALGTFTITATWSQTALPTATQTPSIPTGTATVSSTPAPTAMIQDAGFSWSPQFLTVTVGTNVTWAWVGFHDVVSDSGAFNSGGAVSPGSFNFTFNSVGTFPYHCAIHGSPGAGMYGIIYVIPVGTPTSTVSPSETQTPLPSATPTPAAAAMIQDSGFSWSPQFLTVTVGTNVTWAWVGFHDVVSDSGAFNSGGAVSPGNFNFTFNSVGTFPYHCAIHGSPGAGMYGVIYVIPAGTPTSSVTPSRTVTPPSTATRTPTPSDTPTPVLIPVTPTFTSTTVIATATTVPDDPNATTGPIVRTYPAPNPNPVCVSVQLNRQVDKLTLKVYSTSMMVIDSISSGPKGAGWAPLSLPPAFVQNAPNGTYYYVITAEKNGSPTRTAGTGKLLILR